MDETISIEYKGYHSFFKEEDKGKTILAPWFTDFLSPFIPALAKLAGYHIVNCPKTSKTSADIGLMYGNNEVCYPATLILGDLIAEIQTGKYNTDELAVGITQTGGQCRATNYVGMIKAGLKSAGFDNVPVVVISLGGVFQNEQSGFKLPIYKIINIAANAFFFGDALNMLFAFHTVREKQKGKSQEIFDGYISQATNIILQNKPKELFRLLQSAVTTFDTIEIFEDNFDKVGLVGEIFVKYNNYGQAHITEWLRAKGMEVVTPSMIDFFIQAFVNQRTNSKNGVNRLNRLKQQLMPLGYKIVNRRLQKFENIVSKSRAYVPRESIFEMAKNAEKVLNLSNQFGEGWMIAGEVANFAAKGINSVVCVQPFGCIANHIVAKGIEKRLKKIYPTMNLLFLDIDGGIAEVNLQNRLEFLISKDKLL